MNGNDSSNKIESVYNRKDLLFHKKESFIKLSLETKIKNKNKNKNYFISFNNTTTKRVKSSKNKINEILKINNEKEYCLPNLSHKTTIDQELLTNKNKIISPKIIFKNNNLVKKNNIIYLLRKLYIILPNNKSQMYTKYYPSNLFFYFYFPINIINSKINSLFIKKPNENDILCDDLSHILHETFKYLKLSIYDSIKMEIYDEKFKKIIKEVQLFSNKKRIIYVKITQLNEEEAISWKKRINSKLFPLDDNYLIGTEKKLKISKIPSLYRDVSTEYNKNDTKIDNKNKLTIENMTKNEKDINEGNNIYLTDKSNLSINKTYFKTLNNESKKVDEEDNYENQVIDNAIVSSDENNFLKLKSRKSGFIQKYIIEKALNTESKGTQGEANFINNNHNKEQSCNNKLNKENSNNSINKKDLKNYKEILKKKFRQKDNKNILIDLIKKNKSGYIKNVFLPSLLFNFDVNDIINNEYILKYLTNKNKDEIENDIFLLKNRSFKLKNLNDEENSSHRNQIIKNYNLNKNNNKKEKENDELVSKQKQNKLKFCNINSKIKEFIKDDIDNLLTKEETDDFKSLNCNYILINELKEFPITKLKKEFIFFTCLSNRMKLKFDKLSSNIISILLNKNADFKDIFLLNDIDNFLNYLEQLFNNIINNKMYIFRNIGSSNKNLRISYLIFFLFIIYNKNLAQKKIDKNLIYIIMECIDINSNTEINFQQYCDYKLLMTNNKYINFNKKFNFIKDFFLRALVDSKFNKNILIKRLRSVFDVYIIDIKNIFYLDMCSVKLKKNLDIYNKVEILYEALINYYSY